jgi:hypothetical protein
LLKIKTTKSGERKFQEDSRPESRAVGKELLRMTSRKTEISSCGALSGKEEFEFILSRSNLYNLIYVFKRSLY